MIESLIAKSTNGQTALTPVEGALYGLSKRLKSLLDCQKLRPNLIIIAGNGDDAADNTLKAEDFYPIMCETQVAQKFFGHRMRDWLPFSLLCQRRLTSAKRVRASHMIAFWKQ